MRRSTRILAFLCCIAAPALAQRRDIKPRRPVLPRDADTNSALAYRDYGFGQLKRDPRRAAAAFYWASRLDPTSAEHVYAYRVALLLDDPALLRGYLRDDPGVLRSLAIRQLDSLMRRALMLNPFFLTWLDDELITQFIMSEVRNSMRRDGVEPSETELSFEVESWLRSHDSGLRPYLDYARGRFREALETWAEEARRHPKDAMPRARRARAMFLSGRLDSAQAELTAALSLARARDADSIRFFYESKAAWEYALGRIFEGQGRTDSARAAYERALVEDLGYYPAHMRLGVLRLVALDTAGALVELGRAVEVKEDEYLPQLYYAATLKETDRLDSAEAHAQRAIELEPWAAVPRVVLGSIRDQRGDGPGALAAFEEYLARAPRTDANRPPVRRRVEALRAGRP